MYIISGSRKIIKRIEFIEFDERFDRPESENLVRESLT